MTEMPESFGNSEHSSRRRRTKREEFLEKMGKPVPQALLVDLAGLTVRTAAGAAPRYPPETILRGRCLQPFFSLGDCRTQDILHDMPAARRFVGLSCGRPMPDETTMSDFRRLPELHVLGEAIFRAISRHLESKGFRLSRCRMLDATIIAASSATKNKERARDPEMHSTQKGRRQCFGMKLRIGVEEETGLTHSPDRTPANKSDVGMAGGFRTAARSGFPATPGIRGRATARRTRGVKLTGRSQCGGASGRRLARTGRRRPRRGARRRCRPGSSIRSGG